MKIRRMAGTALVWLARRLAPGHKVFLPLFRLGRRWQSWPAEILLEKHE